MRTLCILLTLLFLIGCRSSSSQVDDLDTFLQRASHSHKRTGDFGAFFTQKLEHYGGQPQVSKIPPLSGSWYYESDHNGFAAELYGVEFTNAQTFMMEVYGPPFETSTNGIMSWELYKMRPGAAVQFFNDTNGITFLCVHSQSHKEIVH